VKLASERFLVIKLADLGDALTATPALRVLRTAFPEARIDVLVTSIGASALAGLDSFDRVCSFEKAQFDRLRPRSGPLREALGLGLRLRLQRYDRVFLFHHLLTGAGRLKYAALLSVIGAPWRGGLAEEKPWFLTDVATERGYGLRHEADYWLDVVGLAGARPRVAPRFEIAVDDAARKRAADILGGRPAQGRPSVALYPGSGGYSEGRRWSEAGYGEVGRRLTELEGVEILIVGTEGERSLAERVRAKIGPSARNLAGESDLKTLAALLETCALVIGNDGGVLHVAVAAGAPVLAIFGPSNQISWGPYRGEGWVLPGTRASPAAVLRRDLPCSPCLYRGFLPGTTRGCLSHDCLTLITPDEVVDLARHMLAARRTDLSRISERRT
jgi:ADP-heptose:LPS heptosyltransferase